MVNIKNLIFRRIICNLKETEPHEELYELDEEEDEILPEPTVENLTYIAREIKPVKLNLNFRTFNLAELIK